MKRLSVKNADGKKYFLAQTGLLLIFALIFILSGLEKAAAQTAPAPAALAPPSPKSLEILSIFAVRGPLTKYMSQFEWVTQGKL